MCFVYCTLYKFIREQKSIVVFLSFQGMIPRIVLTRYKMHNEEENIEASQRTVTDNGKCF